MIFLLQELPYIRTNTVLEFETILFNNYYNIVNKSITLSDNVHISSFTDYAFQIVLIYD
jgi:hypothetical protein